MSLGITRRHVLAAMAASATAGALGIGTVAWQWWERPPGEGLAVLSQQEHDIVQAIAEGWMPAGGVPALSGADAELGRFMDQLLSEMPPLEGKGLKMLIHAIDDLTVITHGSRFHALPVQTRGELIQQWLGSRNNLLRSAVTALMALLSLGWTAHPEVAATLQPMFRCGYGR